MSESDGLPNDQYLALARVCSEIIRAINRIDNDLSDDRSKLDTILVRQGKIEEMLERLMSLYDRQTKKVRETVDDAVEKQMEELQDGVKTILSDVADVKTEVSS